MARIAEVQAKDPEIAPVYKMVAQSEHRPSYNGISHWNPAAKALWAQWGQLTMNRDVLCRLFIMAMNDQSGFRP